MSKLRLLWKFWRATQGDPQAALEVASVMLDKAGVKFPPIS